jgi:hypothetical protein
MRKSRSISPGWNGFFGCLTIPYTSIYGNPTSEHYVTVPGPAKSVNCPRTQLICASTVLLGEKATIMFHIVASTGRTATTYISHVLSQVEHVAACHEGYLDADRNAEPIIPLINIENQLCYKSSKTAQAVVEGKRNHSIISKALEAAGCDVLIDVAYYNPTIMGALLQQHPSLQVLGIIRRCEDFVRSAAFLSGEDTLAVGWPAPGKDLTEREKFISLGRMRPLAGSEAKILWGTWGSIERNIWLWLETNKLILKYKKMYPERVTVLQFELLKTDGDMFWKSIFSRFGLSPAGGFAQYLEQAKGHKNVKTTGYQVPESSAWTDAQRRLLSEAVSTIDRIFNEEA